MKTKIFNTTNQNGIYLSHQYYQSKRITKYRSIYDANTDNTIVMVDIDRATVYESNEFYGYVQHLILENKYNLIIDLDNVYFIDSVFFGTLIKLYKEISRHNGSLKLIVDYNSKPELLTLSNFEGIFEIYPNLFEALNQVN